MRVNRPTEFIVVRNNIARSGGGVISFGSETSGGIRKVVAYHNRGIGTNEGIRFKSAKTRGGFVEDVLIRDLKLENVPLAFTFTLNWNPSYSYAVIPPEVKDIPAYWRILGTPVMPPERGFCEFRNITIENVTVVNARRIFSATGLPGKPITNVKFANVTAEGLEAGIIENARDWTMQNVQLRTADGKPVKLTDCKNVETPSVIRSNVWRCEDLYCADLYGSVLHSRLRRLQRNGLPPVFTVSYGPLAQDACMKKTQPPPKNRKPATRQTWKARDSSSRAQVVRALPVLWCRRPDSKCECCSA